MRFEINPQLVLSQEELITLDNALKLCRDMDCQTSAACCSCCPKKEECTGLEKECVFVVAHKALKEIIDMSVIK